MKETHGSSAHEHKKNAARGGSIPVAVVTVSDSRTEETDINGKFLKEEIQAGGNPVAGYRIIPDEPGEVEKALMDFTKGETRIVLFNGGTGISKRDTTIDVLLKTFEKTLPGFGELFRMLSFEQVGAAAMFSRAIAGVYRDTVIISTPGSPAAVKLAWEKLISPELAHLAWEVVK